MSIVQDPAVSDRSTSVSNLLIEGVYAFILVVTISTWTVAGFGVWIPLLIRSTTLLAASVFYATLFRDQTRVTLSKNNLHFAVRMYSRGFQHFIDFYRQRNDPEPPVGLFEPLSEMKWKELFVECAWVAGVWILLYFAWHGPIGVGID